MSVRETLSSRGKKYGGYKNECGLTDTIVSTLKTGNSFKELTALERHTLYMITLKMVRIVSGGMVTARDSWVDIAGYSSLALSELGDEEKEA